MRRRHGIRDDFSAFIFCFTVGACFCFVCPKIYAGGLEVPDLGSVAIGRGGAFVARADNLSAFYYNPAGLSKNKGVNLLLGVTLVNLKVDYLRSGSTDQAGGVGTVEMGGVHVYNPSQDYAQIGPENPQPSEYQSISGERSLSPLPMMVLSWGDAFNVEGLAIAAGLITPSSFWLPTYPEGGTGRYAIRDGSFLIASPGIGVSYAINRYISVGGVFLSGVALLDMSVAIRPTPRLSDPLYYNENVGGDADLSIDTADWFAPSGILGVLSNPFDWLEVGVAVKLPQKIEAEGRAVYTAPTEDLINSDLVSGRDNITLRFHFPWVVRAGVRYIHRYFDIEADFVWENWSSFERFEFDMDAELYQDAVAEEGRLEMPDAEVPKAFRDTYSVRLGGDVNIWPEHIAVRMGGFYQSSAYPRDYETFNLDFPFGEQIGLGGGLTWHTCSYLDVNLAYLHVFQFDVEVDDGVVQQIGLPIERDGQKIQTGNTVNNGTYEVGINLFTVSLEGHF
jgi:long-subunit fatty acid transport protein